MSLFNCPVCKNELYKKTDLYRCQNNHCFDISKHGYVNLLQSQKNSTKRHGDDKVMVNARKEFLDKGYYYPLLKAIFEIFDKHSKSGMKVLDAGCGECYYTANICEHLKKNGIEPYFCGVDIAKDALIAASHRSKSIELAVASVFDIPVGDCSFDIILNFFAPVVASEYKRILKNEGILICAVPLRFHLWELKSSVYDTPYENEEGIPLLDGFDIVERKETKDFIFLESNEDIQNLFKMTPYYYKTSRTDQAKLQKLDSLKTKIEFGIYVYKKK
ncbi:MAG: methyltransferase domain-containing protein [Oscillospiraceae bacterium]